jgi:hypothetical protein
VAWETGPEPMVEYINPDFKRDTKRENVRPRGYFRIL